MKNYKTMTIAELKTTKPSKIFMWHAPWDAWDHWEAYGVLHETATKYICWPVEKDRKTIAEDDYEKKTMTKPTDVWATGNLTRDDVTVSEVGYVKISKTDDLKDSNIEYYNKDR